jgi:3-hydroxy-9,10-secoandrosta-1,3,5(10)-triene-9,17-dione monooxygenase
MLASSAGLSHESRYDRQPLLPLIPHAATASHLLCLLQRRSDTRRLTGPPKSDLMEGKVARAQVETKSDPVVLAAELRPLLARNAVQAERDRCLPQANIDALEAANLFKLMTPRRWNGYGIPLAPALSAHAELAKSCASTAWVTMIIGACLWLASLLRDRGQEEIFESPADLRIAGVISATIKGRRVAGGMRVSGKNGFASGCLHSSWALLCFAVEDAAHNVVDQVIGFAPMSEIEIEDTWFVAGMRGTGSNTLVAKDLFIPDHRIFPLKSALEGDRPRTKHALEISDRWAIAQFCR